MAPGAVVFDLDGTLADSAPDIAHALNTMLAANGLVQFRLDRIKTFVGGGADLLIERALRATGEQPATARIQSLLADFLNRYRAEPCRLTTLYPGAREVLRQLAEARIPLAICTNKPADLTTLVLDRLGIGPHFASVVAATPDLEPKPAPDMLLRVLRELGVAPEDAVMVGDSAADTGVAKAAGVRSILLRHGYAADIDDLGADIVLDGFADLIPALGELQSRAADGK